MVQRQCAELRSAIKNDKCIVLELKLSVNPRHTNVIDSKITFMASTERELLVGVRKDCGVNDSRRILFDV